MEMDSDSKKISSGRRGEDFIPTYAADPMLIMYYRLGGYMISMGSAASEEK